MLPVKTFSPNRNRGRTRMQGDLENEIVQPVLVVSWCKFWTSNNEGIPVICPNFWWRRWLTEFIYLFIVTFCNLISHPKSTKRFEIHYTLFLSICFWKRLRKWRKLLICFVFASFVFFSGTILFQKASTSS